LPGEEVLINGTELPTGKEESRVGKKKLVKKRENDADKFQEGSYRRGASGR